LINDPMAPYNTPLDDYQEISFIKHPRVIGEDIINDDDDDNVDEYEL